MKPQCKGMRETKPAKPKAEVLGDKIQIGNGQNKDRVNSRVLLSPHLNSAKPCFIILSIIENKRGAAQDERAYEQGRTF